MAYSTMSNQANGYLVLSTDWNQLLANDQADYVASVTTAGDLAYATGANALTRLAIGTSGTMLRSTGSAPAWSNITVPQIGRVTTDQSISTSTTFTDATNMTFSINASEVWIATFYCIITSANNPPGLKLTVAAPASPTLFSAAAVYNGSGSVTSSGMPSVITTSGTDMIGAVTWVPNTQVVSIGVSITNGANAGAVKVQFAQATSNATNTTMKAGSYFIAHRVS